MALKVPPEQRPAHPARTLAGLRADHARFVASGSDIRSLLHSTDTKHRSTLSGCCD